MLPEIKKFNFLKNQSSQGTPNYMPPEIINNSLKCGIYSDLWSLGCIIYDMIYGHPPFIDKTEYLVFENIITLKYSFPPDREIKEDVKDIIEKLLQIDPINRISYSGDLTELKSHKFFSGFDSETIQSDLREYFKPNKPKKYSTANQILTSHFHKNSILNKQSKIINSCKNKKNYKSSDLNYWDDTFNDDEETNFNSSNNNSNINCHHVNAILNPNNSNNNNNINNNNINIDININNENECKDSLNQNYFSCLKVKNKKNSKQIKNYKKEKKNQRESNIDAKIDNSISDFDEEDHLEDISKEELDELKQVYIPSHHFDVRKPKNNSVKNLGLKFNFTNFEIDLSENSKIVIFSYKISY